MKTQRTIAALMGAAMICTMGLTAAAVPTTPNTTPGTPSSNDTTASPSPETNAAMLSVTTGTITEIVKDGDAIIGIVAKPEGKDEAAIRFNIDPDTAILRDDNGAELAATAFKVGDKISAFHGQAMTRSIPAQTYAHALILVDAKKASTSANMLTAATITANDDGSVSVLDDRGIVIVTIAKDTPISAYKTKNIVKVQDIAVGTRFLAWYDIVAMSMPGQAHANRVVILPALAKADVAEEAAAPDVTPKGAPATPTITKDGKIIADAKMVGEVLMVPLREVATATGFTVSWDKATQSVLVKNDKQQATITIGMDLYTTSTAIEGAVGMAKPAVLGAAPFLEAPGTTWVPAKLFQMLMGEGEVTISASGMTL